MKHSLLVEERKEWEQAKHTMFQYLCPRQGVHHVPSHAGQGKSHEPRQNQ